VLLFEHACKFKRQTLREPRIGVIDLDENLRVIDDSFGPHFPKQSIRTKIEPQPLIDFAGNLSSANSLRERPQASLDGELRTVIESAGELEAHAGPVHWRLQAGIQQGEPGRCEPSHRDDPPVLAEGVENV
jgi:hypothetical protein